MKFDRIVTKIILEVKGETPYPDIKATYTKNPELALSKLKDSYQFLKDYPHDDYNPINTTENKKIGNAAMHIALTVRDSNLDTYKVSDNKTLSKKDLLKNVLIFCQQFGDHVFAPRPKIIIKDLETSGKKESIEPGPYPVPPATEGKGLLKDMYGETIEPGMVRLENGNIIIPPRDDDGNVKIPQGAQKVGTWLSGSDYRLSMYNSTEEIRRHGGITLLHHVYREIFPMLGLRYQEGNRAGREARIEGQEEGEAALPIQSFPVYWWGENYLPYRTALKVRNNKVVRVERMNTRNQNAGGINWRTDQFEKVVKPRPLVTVGGYEGPYSGDMQYDKTIDEVRRAIQYSDYDVIRKETADISQLFKDAKTDQAAKIKLRELILKQEQYQALSPEEKRSIYIKRIKQYNSAYNEYAAHTIRPEITERPEDAYPYFTSFYKNEKGIYKFKAMSAKEKFEELYPPSELPDLYSNR